MENFFPSRKLYFTLDASGADTLAESKMHFKRTIAMKLSNKSNEAISKGKIHPYTPNLFWHLQKR